MICVFSPTSLIKRTPLTRCRLRRCDDVKYKLHRKAEVEREREREKESECLLVVSHLSLSLPLLCLMKHVQRTYLMHDKPPRLVAARSECQSLSSARRAITIANAIGFNLWSRSTTSAKCSTDDGWGEGAREREKEPFFPLTTHENAAERDKGGISRVKRQTEQERGQGSFSFRPVIKERLSFCFDIRISRPSSLSLSPSRMDRGC